MNTVTAMAAAPSRDTSDTALWTAAGRGDQAAFRHIVERHQSMVCAAAYAGLGDLAQSEDVAQETFVIAWRKLASLREPDQLRAWLCGIARTLAKNARRRKARRGGDAVALAAIAEPDAPGLSPLDTAIARDQAAMLDRALAGVPESCREVLVLFYREDQSVAAVAEQLGLSEVAVRQRLSRGRALLREEVTAMVETALVKSRPASAFTTAVLAAIAVAGPAGGAVSAQGPMAAASAAAASQTASGLGVATLAGPMTGAATTWLAARLVRAGARSREEAQTLGRFFAIGIGFALGMVAVLLAGLWLGRHALSSAPWVIAIATTAWTVMLLGGLMSMQAPMRRAIERIRIATGTTDAEFEPELIRRGLGSPGPVRWETRTRVFGLPLVAYSSGGLDAGGYSARSACAWIAVGDLAISPLFAAGGVAIAPVAIGGVTLGVLSFSIGGVALGGLAIGSLAFGWVALGVVAVAWRGAVGAVGIAHDYALGPAARAIHANTDVATTWFRDQWFVAPAGIFVALIPWLVLLSIVIPLGLLARRAWRMRGLRQPDRHVDLGSSGTSAASTLAATPASANGPTASTERVHALDALRAVALLLGLVLHSTMPYVLPAGVWAVSTTSVDLLGWLAYYLHTFRLEVFFLLAGFFGAVVVAKRGVAAWIRDRAIRVLLVFVVALLPMKIALAAVWIWGGRTTGWLQLPEPVASLPLWMLALGAPFEEPWPAITTTHLWFLYYLSIVVTCWVAARVVLGWLNLSATVAEAGGRFVRALLSSHAAPLWLAVVTTPILASMQGMDIDTPDRGLAWHLPVIALYGGYFAIGWALHQARDLFAVLAARWARLLFGGVAVSFVAVIGVALRHEGGPWALANADLLRWLTSFGTSLAMALSVLGWIGVFVKRLNRPSAPMRYLADASYWIYITHLPVMVAFQVWWAGSGLPWWIQVPLVNAATLAVTLTSYRWMVRSTWVGTWLNGARR